MILRVAAVLSFLLASSPSSSSVAPVSAAEVATGDPFPFPHPRRPFPPPLGCVAASASANDSFSASSGSGNNLRGSGDNAPPSSSTSYDHRMQQPECPICDAKPRTCHGRIRRSWSTLTEQEQRTFINAMHIIKQTPTLEGRELYGPDFRNYDEFILQHAAGVADPRGDQSHLDQHFIFFHRLLLLQFENTLLNVAPSLGGLPYWNVLEGIDVVFGSDPDLQFGSSVGTGPNHEVQDGAFANWTVSPYADHQAIGDSIPLFDNYKHVIFSNETGQLLLRSSHVPTNSLVRYPTCASTSTTTTTTIENTNSNTSVAEDKTALEDQDEDSTHQTKIDAKITTSPILQYDVQDYETCVYGTQTLEEFYWCLESPTTHSVHEFIHFWIGSADSQQYGFGCPNFAPPNLKKTRQGDYIDKLTSPNDPIFFLHHAFVDMMSMEYQLLHHSDDDAAMDYWGFKAAPAPTEEEEEEEGDNKKKIGVTEGTLLEDVVGSDAWPFRISEVLVDYADTTTPGTSTASTPEEEEEEEDDDRLRPMTYAETICRVGPKTAIYAYDKHVTMGASGEESENIGSTTTAKSSGNLDLLQSCNHRQDQQQPNHNDNSPTTIMKSEEWSLSQQKQGATTQLTVQKEGEATEEAGQKGSHENTNDIEPPEDTSQFDDLGGLVDHHSTIIDSSSSSSSPGCRIFCSSLVSSALTITGSMVTTSLFLEFFH